MADSEDGVTQLETLLGHLTPAELSLAMTRRVSPGDTQVEAPKDFEVPIIDPSNRLDLGEEIGKGGEGVVQLGVQKSLERQVAVKRLRPDRLAPGSEAGLWREAWIGGLLTHPNIVAVYDLDTDDSGKPAIVCQHVDGDPWTKFLEDDFKNGEHLVEAKLENHLRILLRVCDAVAFAHDRGFLHRDLKPDNVMLGKFGAVYLIDWGIAIALDGRHGNRFPVCDEVHSISGTPGYMAPELIRDSDDHALYVGIPTDVYLLGAILFQILCGRAPHLVGQFDKMLESIRLSTFTFPPQVPSQIAAICAKALARVPSERYQSASELGDAITEFLATQRARAVLAEADQKLAELVLTINDESSEGAARFSLYRLFSECKFGYGAVDDVLAADTRRGITAAAEAMVGYELDRGDPDAAEAILAEVDDVSSEVVASISRARVLKETEFETLRNYAAVGRTHDAKRGVRARFFLGCLGVALLFAGPTLRLIGHRLELAVSSWQQIATATFAALSFGAVVWFSRRYLRRHAVTRAAAMIFLAVGVIHTMLGISAYAAAIDPGFVRIVNCYIIAMSCIVFGWLFERGMLWSGLVFIVAGLVISTKADDVVFRNLVIVGGGVLFSLNAFVVWGPFGKKEPAKRR